MLEREINTLNITNWPRTERLIEQICAREGLWVAMKDAIRQKPGGTVWHLKKEGLPGTLELAVWPEQTGPGYPSTMPATPIGLKK